MSVVSWPRDVVQFLREVRTEGKKVSWPDRKQVVSASAAVLIFVFVTAAYFGLLDFVIGWFLEQIL